MLVIFYAISTIRIYLFGKRVRAVVIEASQADTLPLAVDEDGEPAGDIDEHAKDKRYTYTLEYEDAHGRKHMVRENPGMRYQEFKAGETVTVFLHGKGKAEILSRKRLLFCSFLIALTTAGLIAGYFLLLD